MKFLNYGATVFLFSFFLVTLCYSQISNADQSEGKQLSDSANGYRFTAPFGFESNQSDEGFALANAGKTIILVVKSHNFQNFQKFAEQANLEKDGFSLVGKIQDFGEQNKTFRASKQTPQGLLITDTFVLFSPFGGGALVVAISDSSNAERAFSEGLKVSRSMEFSKPITGAAGNQLQNLFRGKHLLYFYTASGFSERTDIFLCPSGAFFYRTDTSSTSGNFSGITAGNADGNWKITSSGNNASLILQFNSGSTRQYRITARQASNEIGLNGNRFFVQNHNRCN